MKILMIDADIDHKRRTKLSMLSGKIEFACKYKDSTKESIIEYRDEHCNIEEIYNTLMEYLELENHSNMNIGNLDLSKLLTK